MSPVIRISPKAYNRLQALAEPFTDTPASVIERLLDLHENKQKVSETSFETSKTTSDKLKNLPDTLDQVLKVCLLVWDKGKTYQEAVTIVSRLVDIEPNTVRDKCTRLISIKGVIKVDTTMFLEFLNNREEMADHLLRKFPKYQQVIEKYVLQVENESEDNIEEGGEYMTHLWEIWEVMKKHMNRGRTFTLEEIYTIVERHCTLKKGDFDPEAPGSSAPKWKRNVRNVLQKKKDNEVRWGGRGEYSLV